ncbi:MAG: hypothetical protein C7B46_19985 [Sulfobacillus benefaciens]|uniref:Uncharacterized protein n=1 Tax=Sulfobacillus benefaciens TaxID=453960 RepID=A0A2T2WVZ0_9FIRM|nr:MAG: hypothetical protein C7B46_19985 [Sulfobacillus benefaciens]
MNVRIKQEDFTDSDGRSFLRMFVSGESVTDPFLIQASAALAVIACDHAMERTPVPTTMDEGRARELATALTLTKINEEMVAIRRDYTMVVTSEKGE